jgi:hypothetical protein
VLEHENQSMARGVAREEKTRMIRKLTTILSTGVLHKLGHKH